MNALAGFDGDVAGNDLYVTSATQHDANESALY